MARLTNDKYYKDHELLFLLWYSIQNLFSVLTPTQQQAIHDFCLPTANITKNELLDYREYISKLRPSLPHKAGRALKWMYSIYLVANERAGKDEAKFRAIINYFRHENQKKIMQGKRRIRVSSIRQPQIDIERLGRALIELEYQRAKLKH